MDPITVSAAGAANSGAKWAEVGGNIAASAAQFVSAERQMRFQERMSGSAIQRQVADARKAGINPLYLMGNAGADVPSGAMISPDNPMRNFAQNYFGEKQSGPQRTLMSKQALAATAAADASSAAAGQARTQSLVNLKNVDKMDAEIKLLTQNVAYSSAQTAREVIENYKRRAGKSIYKLPYIGPAIGAAKELLGGWR